ncbi:MAG TPA: GAF domain-containing protein [Desulfobacterales bacterium]|nr:GAF domain-containing protein [Desulfobacterales bacterium]
MNTNKFTSALRNPWAYFALAFIPTLVVFILYGINIVKWRNSPDFGWRTMYESGPNMVTEAFKRGEEAGLRVGDTILAINGQAYSTFDELFFKIRHEEPGSVNAYTVMRDGKEREISIITGRLGLLPVLRRSGPLFVIGFVYFMIGVLVFLMKPRARESWLFLVMTSFLGAMISYQSPSDLMRPLWLFNVRNFIEIFLPAPMMYLALRFPKTRTFLIKQPKLVAFPFMLSLILFVIIRMNSTAYWNIPSTLNHIYNLSIMLSVLTFLVSMVWNFLRDPSAAVRLQSQAILVGIFIGFFIPVADLLARSYLNVYLFPDPVIGFMLFLTAFPLSIGFTIVKYDLFAIDAVIKRTYGYLLTTGTIAGSYALFVLVSNLIFGRFEVTKSPIFPVVFILAVIFLFNPIRNRVQRFIDRVFYRLEYDYQETIQRISETMRTLLGLDEIGKSIMDTALGAMFIDSGSVMLLNREKQTYQCLTRAGKREERRDRTEAESTFPVEKAEEEGETAEVETGEPQEEISGQKEEIEEGLRVSELKLSVDEPLIQKIAERKKEVTIYDIEGDPFFEAERESCKKTFDQMEATLIVPLIYEDRLTGLISLGDKKSGKFYRREDINLLKTLANQGAVAIENAMLLEEVIEKERMEEELAIAHDLQTSMLPATCPEIEGFEIAALSTSAREVGGDFYDFIEMGDDRVGLVVGDVTGKSVSGALVMSASRSVFRMLSEVEMSVDEIMIRANRRTKKDITSGMFVALLYAVIDANDRILSLCSAGQTQPIHFCAETGEATLVQTEGDTFPLGILDDAEYQETRLQLAPGDRVVFYTDGIVEAMNEKEELFGFERLLEVVKGARSMSADSLLKEIMERVNAFAGGAAQHDDLTVIVVSVEE